MGLLDRLFGGTATDDSPPVPHRSGPAASRADSSRDDARAVERYRYLLRTAPPETIEAVHAEAFAKLTDQQRAVIYEELSKGAGTGERPLSSEPATLARSATRAEMRTPGAMERVVGGSGNGAFAPGGMGSMIAGSLLGTVAGYVIGSALVSAFLPWDGGWGGDGSAADSGQDTAPDADAYAADAGAADFGADFGF
jgi:hypothetical protein